MATIAPKTVQAPEGSWLSLLQNPNPTTPTTVAGNAGILSPSSAPAGSTVAGTQNNTGSQSGFIPNTSGAPVQSNTPVSNNPTTPTTGTSSDGSDAGYSYFANPESLQQNEQSEYEKLVNQSQGDLANINQEYDSEINQANEAGNEEMASAGAALVSAGLQNSTAAGSALGKNIQYTTDQINTINAKRAVDISTELQNIQQNARNYAVQDVQQQQTNAENQVAYAEQKKSDATASIKNLAASETNWDAFKQNHPDLYQNLVDAFGGDANQVDAVYAMSKPQGTVVTTTTQGSTYFQVTKDPVTGAITTQKFDLGFTPPPNWKFQKLSSTAGMYMDPNTFNPADPSTYKMFDVTNPVTQENLALTAANKEQSLKASYARTANSILRSTGLLTGSGSSGGTGSIPARFYSAVPIIDRIKAAQSQDPSAISDEDIIDALVSINTGGGKPGQSQFEQIVSNLGVKSKADIMYNNYMNNSSSFLPQDIRDKAVKLALANFDNLQKSKDNWDKTASDILSKNGLTPDQFDITTDSTFLNPPTTTDTTDSSSDGSGNPDTFTDSSGNTYTLQADGSYTQD